MRCRVTVVGYVCVCVCVRFTFFQAVTNRSRRPTDLLSAAVASFIICFLENNLFTKIQNLSGSRIGTPVGHFAYSRRHPSVYLFTWCCSRPCGIFVTDFVIVFGVTLYSAHAYLHHWTLTSTTCNRSPEGRDTETFYDIAIASCAEGLAL